MTDSNITALRDSHGALVLGCYFGLFLSGVLVMQVYSYFKLSPKDRIYLKGLVSLIWFLDCFHTIMACNANWMNVIVHFGDYSQINRINWSIAVTVAITAIITFIVHCFFVYRIYSLSNGNKIFTITLALMALFRLGTALTSTVEMIRLASYEAFVQQYAYVFTLGLSSAVALDIFITIGLIFYLHKARSGFSSTDEVVDTLILYTVETGMATCVVTIASLICWIRMPHNLIFLGLHLTLSKLYANSLLASLNSRASLSRKFSVDRISLPMLFSSPSAGSPCLQRSVRSDSARESVTHAFTVDDIHPISIRIEKTVHTDTIGASPTSA